jgi:hypothetical protein
MKLSHQLGTAVLLIAASLVIVTVPVSAALTRAQIQALLDAMPADRGGTVHVPPGLVDLGSTPLHITANGQVTKCAGAESTVFRYRGTGAAIRNRDDTVRRHVVIEDCAFDIRTAGGIAIDWSWWRDCTVSRVSIRMLSSNTRGTYAYGTAKGTPQSCLFSNVDISMRDMYTLTTGSVGHFLDEQITGVGPNGNTFSGGRIAGGSVHVALRAGKGNAFRDIISESATTYHIQMGNPYPDGSWWLSGSGNEFTGWYVEGAVQFNPCFARMERRRDGQPSLANGKFGPELQRLIVSLGSGPFLC